MTNSVVNSSHRKDAYSLNPHLVNQILTSVAFNDKKQLLNLIKLLHVADLADILEQISRNERKNLIALWGDGIDGEVLSELEEGVRDDVLLDLPSKILSKSIRHLETDKIVYLLEGLNRLSQEKVLHSVESSLRRSVEHALMYDEDSAGRLMQCELVTAPQHWTVGDTIDLLRSRDNLPSSFYNVIVVSPNFHPIGLVQLGRLLAAKRNVKLVDLLDKRMRTISVEQKQEDVAYAFNQYHMVSAAVVDLDGRLVGTITIDDAMEILEEEAEQGMKKLVGIGDEELSDNIVNIVKTRFPWLLANLFTAIIASLVIAQFASTIEALVAVAVLMPIIASMGGNSGTQTLTVAVRAIATRDLTRSNSGRVMVRELSVGVINGFLFAIIMGVVGYIWYDSIGLGTVLALAMIFNLIIAGLSGILVPIGLHKFGADPAIASGVFLTTVTDIVGFGVTLALATTFLL